jgi:hypothetical protein
MNGLKFTILIFGIFINTCIVLRTYGWGIYIFIKGVHLVAHIIQEHCAENDTESNAVEVIGMERGLNGDDGK